MIKYILISLLFLVFSFTNLEAQSLKELKKMQLDTNSYPLWDTYINKYAPADSAFELVNHFGKIHLFSQRYSVAFRVYEMYQGLFPNRKKSFSKLLNVCLNQAISQKVPRLYFPEYHNIVLKTAPSEEAFVAVQKIAGYYIDIAYFDSAAIVYKGYKELFPKMEQRFDKIIDLLEREEKEIHPISFDSPLNTLANEWDPNPTPDGKRLFFSSNRTGTEGGSDIWFCDIDSNGFKDAMRLGGGVNGKNSETIDNVMFDGSGLTLSGTFAGTFGQYDIYTFIADTSGQFYLKHLPYPINTEYTDESANITADGQALLFCSDRPGGIGEFHAMNSQYHGNVMGNTDIYICLKQNNKWNDPINLGDVINTPYAERTPYLHPDGKTLYFSSDGHYGIGGLDVFVSHRLYDSSWTDWTEPVNLGRYINTNRDDWGYKVSTDGKTAYFAADQLLGGQGGWDIYKLNLPNFAAANPLVTVYGNVRDVETGNPISTIIKYEDLSTGKFIGEIISSSENGAYMLALPLGKNYGIYIEKQGYVPYSTDFDLSNGKEESLHHDIEMQSIRTAVKQQKAVQIDNIYFDYDKAVLKPESMPALQRFSKFLKKEISYSIVIEGHTDEQGSSEYNMELSRQRAIAVMDFLVASGIPPSRLSIKAYGKTMPISDKKVRNEKNRRVSFRLLSK